MSVITRLTCNNPSLLTLLKIHIVFKIRSFNHFHGNDLHHLFKLVYLNYNEACISCICKWISDITEAKRSCMLYHSVSRKACVIKTGSMKMMPWSLFLCCWKQGKLPQDLRDAVIITLYKNKGIKSDCSNYRGITLLSIAGKILPRVLLNRLVPSIAADHIPESQCGFRAKRSTTDMVFTLRQLQEKCREQNKGLYITFVDLTKAFDTLAGKDYG